MIKSCINNEKKFEENVERIDQIVVGITKAAGEQFPNELEKQMIAFFIINKYNEKFMEKVMKHTIPVDVRNRINYELDQYFETFSEERCPEIYQAIKEIHNEEQLLTAVE